MHGPTEIKSTALYERLSRDDELAGDSSSIQTQKALLEDYPNIIPIPAQVQVPAKQAVFPDRPASSSAGGIPPERRPRRRA